MLQISRLNYEFVYLGLELFIYIFYFLKRRINKTTKKGNTKKKKSHGCRFRAFQAGRKPKDPFSNKEWIYSTVGEQNLPPKICLYGIRLILG